ncbi:YbaN family protein [Beduini massiliensis]|uniref:YbaN family protein n=1 Tax=Beduini massiliensis TaxID=1585974 RepID=UPI00059AAF10|nr:YbaN family protein [Beduini massiliensis]
MNQRLLRIVCLGLGILFLVIGSIGVILPILPTTPFLLLASFFFAKGSEKFHRWLIHTKLYQNHIHEFVTTKAMTLKTKLTILLPASAMMILAIFICPVIYGQIVIVFLIIFKYYYFFFRIRTISPQMEGDS